MKIRIKLFGTLKWAQTYLSTGKKGIFICILKSENYPNKDLNDTDNF